MADVVHTPHADAGSMPMQSASQASLIQRIWRAKRYYLYLVPIFALLGVFSYYPPLMALYYSFTNYDGLSGKFIGLENFTDLASDRIFRASIKNAVILLFANTITGVIPPLLVAEMLFSLRSRRMGDFYRTAFLIPTLVPAIVIILTWRYIYHARYGLINSVLSAVGLDFLTHDWLGSFDTALAALVFFSFPWINATIMLILLAALIDIPTELIDAFRLDSSSTFQRIMRVDLPYIVGAIRLVIVLSVIGTLQGFNLQFAMTGGGPGSATMVPAFHMYSQAFFSSRFGYGSAIGTLLFLVIVGLTVITRRYLRSGIEYEA